MRAGHPVEETFMDRHSTLEVMVGFQAFFDTDIHEHSGFEEMAVLKLGVAHNTQRSSHYDTRNNVPVSHKRKRGHSHPGLFAW
jgi:hypothetical protein